MNAEIQYELGMDCLDSERNDDALKHLDKALELDATYAPAYRGRAEVYERIGDYGNAVVNYERYYELVPEDLDPNKLGVLLFFNANALQFMGDYHGALEKYRRSAELCGLVISYYRIGNMHEILGDLGAAMTSYDRALEIDPRQSLSYSGKARIYRKTGAFIDAITSFEELSMLHPKNALPYYYLGIMFYEQGHFRSAISCFGVAISADEVDEEKFNFPDVNPIVPEVSHTCREGNTFEPSPTSTRPSREAAVRLTPTGATLAARFGNTSWRWTTTIRP